MSADVQANGKVTNGLLVRADASTSAGVGHVMRCLALAQVWHDAGSEVIYLTASPSPSIEQRLRSERVRVSLLSRYPAGSLDDAAETAAIARQENAQWIVVDGYHFGAEYQRVLKRARLSVLCVDDMGHADAYAADIVLNQNLGVGESLYHGRCGRSTRLLLGSRYVLLRREYGPGGCGRGQARRMPTEC